MKLRRKPANRVSKETQAAQWSMAPLDLVTLDLVGPTAPDVDGATLLLTTRDVGSNYRRCLPLHDRESSTVVGAFTELYPGSRIEPRPRFPRVIHSDNDGSFKARRFR